MQSFEITWKGIPVAILLVDGKNVKYEPIQGNCQKAVEHGMILYPVNQPKNVLPNWIKSRLPEGKLENLNVNNGCLETDSFSIRCINN